MNLLKILNRLIQVEASIAAIVSDVRKLKADVEYLGIMTDNEIIIEGGDENAKE